MLLSERFNHRPAETAGSRYPAAQRKEINVVSDKIDNGALQLRETRCPCGGKRDLGVVSQTERHGFNLETVICESWGSLRFRRYFTDESLAEFYIQHYQNMYGRLSNIAKYFKRQHAYGRRIFETYRHTLSPRDRILEIGCGAGGALNYFRTKDFDVSGCEYSRTLVEYARDQGLGSVHHGSVFDFAKETNGAGAFRLIYIHHVFEHVNDPAAVLDACRALLADDGHLVIGVPDILGVGEHPELGFDLLPFLHLAHKYNFTTECFQSLALQSQLQYKRVALHEDYPTPWSVQPELWGEFRKSPAESGASSEGFRKGEEVLNHLEHIERDYAKLRSTLYLPLFRSKALLGRALRKIRAHTPGTRH